MNIQAIQQLLAEPDTHVDDVAEFERITDSHRILSQHLPTAEQSLKSLNNEYISAFRARMHRKYDLAKYFEGQGPIATRLRQLVGTLDALSDGALREATTITDMLERFRIPLHCDPEQYKALMALVAEITELVFGEALPTQIPLIPGSRDLVAGAKTAYMLVQNPQGAQHPAVRRVNLVAELGEVKIHVALCALTGVSITFWHPHEAIWLAGDGALQIEGMVPALRAEWDRLRGEIHLPKTKLDTTDMLDSLLEKTTRIFDGEVRILGVEPNFLREGDIASRLFVVLDGHYWIFLNTKGKYPSRANYILKGNAACSVRVHLEEMPEVEQQLLLTMAHTTFDRILRDHIDKQPAPRAVDCAQALVRID